MKRLCFLTLCLLLLLAGCSQPKTEGAASQQEEPATLTAQALSLFPPSYDLSFRLEAFQGEERTSYSHITAQRRLLLRFQYRRALPFPPDGF